MRALAVTATIFVFVLLVAGCRQPAGTAGKDKPAITGAGPATTPEPTAAPAQFTWTERPTLDMIPEGDIVGNLRGKPFAARTVRLRQDDPQTVLEISDAAVDNPTSVLTDDTGVELRFTLSPGRPGELVIGMNDPRDLDQLQAYYYYPQGGNKDPRSVNPAWACALQISEWTLQTDPENQDLVGRAKGKVAITFDDETKSWVAGSFDCVYYKW